MRLWTPPCGTLEPAAETGYVGASVDYELVILDFDGTFTDVEKEAGPFFAAYKADAQARLGIDDFEEAWERCQAKVAADPAHYGWSYGGHIVAPGNADPYLRATVILNMILDERGLLPDPVARRELLQSLYHANYPKADTVFRPHAKQVVEALLASGVPTVVVTNSETSAVEAKLDRLHPVGRERLRVCGDAKKYIVCDLDPPDPRFEAVPAEVTVPGLRRPILTRRGHYYQQLRALWDELNVEPRRTLVVGDIYELDLALPGKLGTDVHLVLKEMTEAYERAAIERCARGELSPGLDGVLQRVGL